MKRSLVHCLGRCAVIFGGLAVAAGPLAIVAPVQAVTTEVFKDILNDGENRPFFATSAYPDPSPIVNDAGYSGSIAPGAGDASNVTGLDIGVGGDDLNGVPMGVTINFELSFTVQSTGAGSVLTDGGNAGLGINSGVDDPNATQLSKFEQLLFDNFQLTNLTIVDPLGLLDDGAAIGNPKWRVLSSPNHAGGDKTITSSDAAGLIDPTTFKENINGDPMIENDFETGVFPAKTPLYVTTDNGNWTLKGIGYQFEFTHELATAPATRRTFKFGEPSGAYPSPSTHQITNGDATITIDAVGNGAVFSTNSEGVGVDSLDDGAAGNAGAQRRIDGTLPNPEAIHFSFDKKVSLESLTMSATQFSAENVVLSFVSGVNPFTGLEGYTGDYTLGPDSLTISDTAVAARSPYPLTLGMGGQDEIVIEAGTVLALTSALKPLETTDGGIILDMITAHVIDADFNDDENVDGVDLATWEMNFGSTTATATTGDADGDGDADGADFLQWQREITPPVETAAVPDPGAAALLLVAAAAGCALRRRAA